MPNCQRTTYCHGRSALACTRLCFARTRLWLAGTRLSLAGTRLWLATLVVLFCASGASCPNILQQYTQPVPYALPPSPTLVQVTDVVNANTAKIQSLSASRVTISTPGNPAVTGNINVVRPRSFRLVADAPMFMGREVDVGSNDELFWFWVRHNQPPAMFYCRHEQYETSAARQILPVAPEFFIEALGVVTFDGSTALEQPVAVGKNRLQIRSQPRPGSSVSRVTIVDDRRGVVLEQHIYDAHNMPLASAIMSNHVRDPATGATLPHRVELHMPPTDFHLTIDMPSVQVNALSADPATLFVRPKMQGYNDVDLAQPNMLGPPGSAKGQLQVQPSVRY